MNNYYYLTAFLLFTNLPLGAVSLNEFQRQDKIIPVYYDYLEHAESDTISIDYIAKNWDSLKWVYYDINKPVTPNKNYWIRFKVKNNSANSLVIEFSKYYSLEVYSFDSTSYSKIFALKGGSNFFEKNYFSGFNVMEIPNGNHYEFVVKVSSPIATSLGFYVHATHFFHNQSVLNVCFYSTIIGGILLFILLGIILFIRLKENIYLCYSFYLISFLFLILGYWGILEFINPKTNNVGFFPLTIPYAFTSIFLMFYVQNFINTKQNYKIFHLIINASIALRLLILLVGIILKNNAFHYSLVDLVLISPCFCIVIYSSFKNYKKTRFMLFSLSLIYFAQFYHTFFENYTSHFVLIPSSLEPYFREENYMFIIYGFLEIILFTLALSDRFIYMKREREKYHIETIQSQNQIIELAKQNEIIQKNFNLKLQEEVALQTKQLEEANEKLRLQAEEISAINKMLQNDNQRLHTDIELLQKAKIIDINTSFKDFALVFPDDNACLKLLEELKWGREYNCRNCGYKKYKSYEYLLSRKCKSCGHSESATAHTLLNNIKFDLNKALYLVFKSYTFREQKIKHLATEIDLRLATVYSFVNKINAAIENQEKGRGDKNGWVSLLI